jgi:hypothetical protein
VDRPRNRSIFCQFTDLEVTRAVSPKKKGCTEPSRARFSAIVSIRPRSPILPL